MHVSDKDYELSYNAVFSNELKFYYVNQRYIKPKITLEIKIVKNKDRLNEDR